MSLENANPAEPVRPDLAITVPEGERSTLLPSTSVLERIMFVSNAIARSGMPLPKNCRTPESIFAKILVGWEHGLGPMTSLHEIHIIEGKASLPASIKVGIVRQRGIGKIDTKIATAQEAVVEVRRNDWPKGKWMEVKFTIDEAREAELLKKDNWRKYPRSMLLARACDLAVHAYFQEVFMGLPYSPDELGAETDEAGRLITTTFEVHDALPTPAAPAAPSPTPTPNHIPARTPGAPDPAPPAPPAAPPEPPPAAEPVTADMCRQLADLLKVGPEHRYSLFDRDGNLLTYYNHLLAIQELRRVRVAAGVDDFQYGAALDRRTVDRDYLLTTEQARGLVDTIYEQCTPSEREAIKGAAALPQLAGQPAGRVDSPPSPTK